MSLRKILAFVAFLGFLCYPTFANTATEHSTGLNLDALKQNYPAKALEAISFVNKEQEDLEIQTNGVVKTKISDGKGGLFIGGDFTYIQGVKRNFIAHLLEDNTVDESWNPNPNGVVDSLVLKESNLFVLGEFSSIGGQERNGIASVCIFSGQVTQWDPSPNGYVWALAITDNVVFVGGDFTFIGGQIRNRIAAINLNTGLATEWNPNANNTVYSIALFGNVVFAAGNFSNIGGQQRHGLAAINSTSGTATSIIANTNGVVRNLTLNRNTLYFGGYFTQVNSQTRNHLAAIDVNTGALSSWNPNANDLVQRILVTENIIYAVGDFTNIGGAQRNRIAALDPITGLATTWNPDSNGPVWGIGIIGEVIYVSGLFTSIGGQQRNRLAAIDPITGLANSWNPNANSAVIIYINENLIYAVGGQLTNVGGIPRNGLAAIDPITGEVTSWDPNPNSLPQTLAFNEQIIFVGGGFSRIGGLIRSNLAALAKACTPPTTPTITAAGATTFCNGGSVIIQGPAISGGENYLWSNGATTQSITVTSSGNYSLQVIAGACTSAISNIVVVTTIPCIFWTGNTSIDWATAANWSGGVVPSGTDEVTVPNNVIRMPTVSGNHEVGNLLNQGVITISGQLSVKGNLTHQGSFAGTGSLNFNGTSPQTISGNQTLSLEHLNISNSTAQVSLQIPASVGKELKLSAGSSFNLNNQVFTLRASYPSRATATLNLTAGNTQLLNANNFTCQIAYPRVTTPATGTWVQTAPPVQGQTVAQLTQRGNTASAASFNASIPANGSFYWYSNSFITFPSNNGYFKPNSASESWVLGRGIRAWIRKNAADAGVFSFVGQPFTGASFQLNNLAYCTNNCAQETNTNGLNLVGNPLAATIDWNLLTRNNVEDALYQFNGNTYAYGTYIDGVAVNGGRKEIAAGQGFFVHALQAGASITVPQTAVVPASTFAIFRSGAIEDLLRININLGDSSIDEMAIRLKDGATNNFDSRYDGRKITGYGINIASIAEDGNRLSVDTRPLSTGMIRIPLVMSTMNTLRNEVLVFTGIESFGTKKVYLNHPSFDAPIQITEGQRFTVSPAFTTGLEVIINNSPQALEGQLSNTFSLYPNPATENLTISGINSGTVVKVLSIQGKEISRQTLGSEGSLSVKALPQGLYFVEINGIKKTFVKQ